MSLITTGSHPKAIWPGVYGWFGVRYNQHAHQYPELFDMKTSQKHYEEMVQQYGFGLAPVKGEGSPVAYQGQSQGPVSRGTHVAYGLGYVVTKEEKDDNLYKEVSMSRAGALAFSMAQTRENIGANVYNRAFNSSYVGGDGVSLLAPDHPSPAGNQSNKLAVAADFSEASLEDLTIQIMDATDPNGLNISLGIESLIGPTALVYEFERILKSDLRPTNSDTHDINALRSLGVIPKTVVNNYFTDSDAWFIRTTGVEHGLCWFDRKPVEFSQDNDFDTENAKAKAYMRFMTMWGDWRSLYGSEGAA